MVWFIVIVFVGYVLFKFFTSLEQDKKDLQGGTLDEKFKFIVTDLNDAAFNGHGSITRVDNRSFNLYQKNTNQIIQFLYSTGHLTITWRYKYYQKEIVHEKQFNDVRNLSLFEQQRIAGVMIKEMELVVAKHQNDVIGGI